MTKIHTPEIAIYQTEDGTISVDVQLSQETLWLSLNQIADLFERDKSVISRHLKNIFKEEELEKNATVAKFATVQTEGGAINVTVDTVERQIDFYNLDAILSVGYRVNSKRGTQFRRWASQILKEQLIQGYSLNQKRLTHHSIQQLQQTIGLFAQTLLSQDLVTDTGAEILHLIQAYTKTWDVLLRYDENRLETPEKPVSLAPMLSYVEAREAISHLKKALVATRNAASLFGQERGESLQGILGTLE